MERYLPDSLIRLIEEYLEVGILLQFKKMINVWINGYVFQYQNAFKDNVFTTTSNPFPRHKCNPKLYEELDDQIDSISTICTWNDFTLVVGLIRLGKHLPGFYMFKCEYVWFNFCSWIRGAIVVKNTLQVFGHKRKII